MPSPPRAIERPIVLMVHVEDAAQHGLGDAAAIVAHAHDGALSFFLGTHLKMHPPAGVCVLGRVVQDVADDLRQPRRDRHGRTTARLATRRKAHDRIV